MAYDTVVAGGSVVTPSGIVDATVAIDGGRIAGLLAPGADVDADRVIEIGRAHV